MAVENARITRFKAGKNTYDFQYLQDWSANFAKATTSNTSIPGMHGSFDNYGDEPAAAPAGSVQLNFALYSSDAEEMTQFKNELRSMGRWGKGRLYMQPDDPNAAERFCFARFDDISDPENLNRHTSILMRVSAAFSVSDPHWYTQGTYPPVWGDGTKWGSGAKWGGGALPNACAGTQTDFTITREGNAPTRPQLVIQCGAAQTAEDVTIQRLENGVVVDEVKYTGVLNNHDLLIINAWSLSVRLNNADGYDDRFVDPVANMDWFYLLTGENALRVKMKNSGDACSVTVKYYEAWL